MGWFNSPKDDEDSSPLGILDDVNQRLTEMEEALDSGADPNTVLDGLEEASSIIDSVASKERRLCVAAMIIGCRAFPPKRNCH
jgi:hypothetical protein